jgi:type III secretion protein V
VESLDRCLELGFEAREDVLEGSRRRRVWVRVDDEQKLVAAGIRYLRWEDVFAADVQVEMLRNCAMFVGVHEIQRFQRWADRCYPELGKELGKAVPLLRLTEVLQRLTKEGISLRNARLVLETILEWAPKERDSDMVADYVRLALKRQLCHEVARDGLIEAVLLSPELEDQIRNAIRQTPQGSYVDLNSETEQALLDQLSELSGTGGTPAIPPVLVTTADIRRSVRKLIEEEFFSVPVFSYSELTPHTRVQPVGMIEL